MSHSTHLKRLQAQQITVKTFKPYGQVIFASADGNLFGNEDAQIVLNQGIPRFYIMRLHHKGRTFSRITRHVQCTQCLGSLEGKEWLIAVAAPSDTAKPDPAAIATFRIPGNCFIKLNLGTWHAGPYFDEDQIDFYNLELSDTNIADHDTCSLLDSYGLEFEIV